MRYFLFALAVYFISCLQVSFSSLTFFGGSINLIVLVLVSSFFLKTGKGGLIFCLILAAIYDFYLFGFFGLALLAVILIYLFLLFLWPRTKMEEDYFWLGISSLVASLIFDIILLLGNSIFSRIGLSQNFLYHALLDAVISLVLIFPFYLGLKFIFRILVLYHLLETRERA